MKELVKRYHEWARGDEALPGATQGEAWELLRKFPWCLGRKRSVLRDELYKKTPELSLPDCIYITEQNDGFEIARRLSDRADGLSTRELASLLGAALYNGQIAYNTETEEFSMQDGQQTSELTSLMYQVAMTNWETTKADLTTPQVATMARIAMQALFEAIFPKPPAKFSGEEAERGLKKVQAVLQEYSQRLVTEQGRLLKGE